MFIVIKGRQAWHLPDKFVVEFVVAAGRGEEGVAVSDEEVENDCGLKHNNYA